MLRFDALELENFGPYFGRHVLEFPSGEGGSVVVVHGQNMTGKTSFINAFRWVLYGTAKDRSGRPMKTRALVNDDAYADGVRRVSARLKASVQTPTGRLPVTLRRQVRAKDGLSEATANQDFTQFLEVDVGGVVKSPNEYDDVVNSLLPEGIARFFLFDGELLREYEDLVSEESTAQREGVKSAIERILGVPAATRGQADLSLLAKEFRRAYGREGKKHVAARAAAEALAEVSEELERVDANLTDLQRQKDEREADLRSYDVELSRFAALREDAGRLQEIRSRIRELAEARNQKLEDRARLVADVWRDILEPRLRQELKRLEFDLAKYRGALDETARIKDVMREREGSASGSDCPTCGQSLPEERRAQLASEMAALNRRLAELEDSANQDRYEELAAAIARLRSVSPAGVGPVIGSIERDTRKADIDGERLRQTTEDIVERMKGLDPAEIANYERKQRKTQGLLAQLAHEIALAEERARGLRARAAQCQKEMASQDVPALRRLSESLAATEQMEALFGAAVAELIAQLRTEVQKHATEVFLTLTTDKSYRGLEINENYGLTILGASGSPISVRSAGAEQVVALSLIGALNRLAAKRGPVIMDTPFGRLDEEHRENILNFLPNLSDQVFLLVHGGEVDPERDLQPVARHIAGEYRIVHPSSTRSKIERVRGGG